jgi:hypothetical protein
VGFLDTLLGKRKLKAPAPDRLFALTTAGVTLETAHDIRSSGKAAIVFQALATSDFDQIVGDMEELVRGTGEETGTTLRTTDDDYGYRWVVFEDPDLDDLVVSVNAVNDALQVGGYGDRVLCAVFAFNDRNGKPLYFIYNVKRGAWYPFVPAGGEQQRDNERELQLKAQMQGELPIEPELERWFPLWDMPI